DSEIRVVDDMSELFCFSKPSTSFRCASLALVDVSEEEQTLALDLGTVEGGGRLDDLFELLACLLELPEHHHDVRSTQAKLKPSVRELVAKHLEGARVVAIRLSETFPPLRTSRGLRERSCCNEERRLDRASSHFT